MLKVTIKRAQLTAMTESAVEEAGVTDSAQPASWPGSFSVRFRHDDACCGGTEKLEMESGGHVSVSVLHEGPSCFTPQLPPSAPSAPSYRSDTRSYQISSSLVVGWGESDYSV